MVSSQCDVQVRFYPPPVELRRYFTTFYFVNVDAPDGVRVSDCLHPEWGNLRLHAGSYPDAENHLGLGLSGTHAPATGPSAHKVNFTIGKTRMWGIGLLPLGWVKFVRAPAASLADALIDGASHPAFAGFAPLVHSVYGDVPDEAAELARITEHFMARLDEPVADEARILAIHAALIDPATASVSEFVARSGIGHRTLERCCARAFGFPPKLLLRRQRFLRSLAQFSLDPSLKWVGAMDSQYHDQAQFVREFRQFMGMSPRAYAALPKPVLSAIMRERNRYAGKAVQALDGPEGGGAPR